MRFKIPLLATFLVSFAAHAGQNLAPRGGWAVINTDKDDLLNIGQIIAEVRVKEFNFFDGMPILSMLPSVV